MRWWHLRLRRRASDYGRGPNRWFVEAYHGGLTWSIRRSCRLDEALHNPRRAYRWLMRGIASDG